MRDNLWTSSILILMGMYFLLLCLFPSKLDIAKISIAILCLAGAWTGFFDKKFFLDPVLLGLIAFTGIAILGNILGAGQISSTLKVLTWTLPFILGKAFSQAYPKHVMRALIWGSFLLSIYMAIALTLLKIQPYFSFEHIITDLTLTFRNLSRTALFLAVGCLISCYALLSLRGPLIRLMAGSSATVLFFALIISGRRTTVAAFLATSGLMLLFRKQYRLFAALFIATLLCIIVVGQTQRFNPSPATILADQSFIERQAVWFAGWKLFASDPLLGSGFGSFKQECQPYVKEYHDMISGEDSMERLEDAHNIIIHFAAETGILGLCAVLFLFGTTCRHGWQLRNDNQAALCLSACLFMAFLHFQMHAHLKSSNVSGLIFLLMGMVMGISPHPNRSK